MEEEKDKVYELELGGNGYTGKLKIQNSNNRVLAKIGDIMLDRLSWFRWNNAVKYLDKYNEMKEERGITGKEIPIAPKYILEILDNAFIEDNDELQKLWVKLLINWQDANKKLDKRPIYIDIIKSLTSTEAKMLEVIDNEIKSKNMAQSIEIGFDKNAIIRRLGITEDDYTISILNLFRNGCFESFKVENPHISMGGINPVKDMGMEVIKLTPLGYNLIKNLQ